jgi:toxin ParE1/3/4
VRRLVISREARTDLRAIANYTEAQWGAARKEQYLAAIRDRFATLRERAELGRPRPDLAPDYRSLLVGAHLIFYRTAPQTITIVRVLHQAMDVKRRL